LPASIIEISNKIGIIACVSEELVKIFK
jgi:hypothetical protein